MTLTVRSATVDGATTKGSPLSHAELDENFNHLSQSSNHSFTPSGSGAQSETVSEALQRLVHTAQYDTQGNYETARAALTGTFGMHRLDLAGSDNSDYAMIITTKAGTAPVGDSLGIRLDAAPATASTQKGRPPRITFRASSWNGSASEYKEAFFWHNMAGAAGPGSYMGLTIQGENRFRFMSGHAGSTGYGIRIAAASDSDWLQLYDEDIELGKVGVLLRNNLGNSRRAISFGDSSSTPLFSVGHESAIAGVCWLGDLTLANLASAAAGELVLANDKSLRGVNAAGTDTLNIAELNSSNLVALGRLGTASFYNAFTDASNYERLEINVDSTVSTIFQQALGTGTARQLRIGTGGSAQMQFFTNNTARWAVSSTGPFIPATDAALDLGGASNRIRDLYVGRWIQHSEVAANPTDSDLAADAEVAIYNKADKFVIAYNNGGTMTYISIPLDGSTTTWTHDTSAP